VVHVVGIVGGRLPAGRVVPLCTVAALIATTLVTGVAAASARAPMPGVTMRRLRLPGPVRAVVLRIDPTVARIEAVAARPARGGSTTLGRLAARIDAAIAVNGDMHRDGRPAHLLIHDGHLLTSGDAIGAALAFDPTGSRASLVVGHPEVRLVRLDTGSSIGAARWNAGPAPGRRLAVFGIPAPPTSHPTTCAAWLAPTAQRRFRVSATGCGLARRGRPGELVAIAPKAGRAGAWIRNLAPGVPLAVRVATRLPVTETAFGGMPVLVHRGSVVTSPCGPLTCAAHPRTAAGVTRGCLDASAAGRCRILLVIVDGRRLGWSVGMTTDRLARLMRRLGAHEAINLDGGASSQLIVGGRTVNRVAPGARRAVVSALTIEALPASSPAGRRPLP
jgi:hypothetical protein